MRISDWSSDVCSSDLVEAAGLRQRQVGNAGRARGGSGGRAVKQQNGKAEHGQQDRSAEQRGKSPSRPATPPDGAILCQSRVRLQTKRINSRLICGGDRKSTRLKPSH